MCGSYIDPKTLEVYVTNNDTQNWLPMFSREARGNAAPDRVLATPHRTWGITADEMRQELYLTIQGAGAVVVYNKGASDYDAPDSHAAGRRDRARRSAWHCARYEERPDGDRQSRSPGALRSAAGQRPERL